MYCKFFGLTDKPFEVTPDPKFLYMTSGYKEILSALIYGIHERRGFIALIGEVGTGKTLMLNALLERLDQKQKVAFIFNSDLTFKQMLNMTLWDLGLATPDEKISKASAIQRLNEFAIEQLERGGNVIIIIDEAQNISNKTMENIRMLSNLETSKHKLVQIILSGQPELDEKLNQHEWRQLLQRISIKRYAATLSEVDTYRYLRHRLTVAGHNGSPLFSKEALKRIWEYSEGIPRKINIMCDNALLIGYALVTKNIDEEIIKEAIDDLSSGCFTEACNPQDILPVDSQVAYMNDDNTSILAEKVEKIDTEERKAADWKQDTFTMSVKTEAGDTMDVFQNVRKAGTLRRLSEIISGFLIIAGFIAGFLIIAYLIIINLSSY